MNWGKISNPIEELYAKKGLSDQFEIEAKYLQKAFFEIEMLWESQFERIDLVDFVMISEAPLWGRNNNYIYNPITPFSQFFYKSDLKYTTGSTIDTKLEFLDALVDLGFIVLDLSPFALNKSNTSINYRTISKKDYFELVEAVAPFFIHEKLNRLRAKSTGNTTFFFRYARVKALFQSSILNQLSKTGFQTPTAGLEDIAQIGGGIDREKLKQILNRARQCRQLLTPATTSMNSN